MFCPKCEKVNKCDCKACNPDGKATDLVIILKDEKLYQCCFCGHKFNEQDSLDFEWDKMIEYFCKKANPVTCLQWIMLKNNLTKNIDYIRNDYTRESLEKSIGIGEFGFEKAFNYHFKMNYRDVNQLILNQLKIKLKRDTILKSIIK